MTNLDVALRFKMLKVGDGAKAVEKDLKGIKGAADAIGKGSATAKLGTDLAKAGGHAKTTKRDIIDLRRETDRLGTSGGGAKAAEDIAKVGRAARAAKKDVADLGKEQERSLRQMKARPPSAAEARNIDPGAGAAVGALGMRVAAPIGAGFTAKRAFDQSVDWDAAWAEVLKKVNDASPDQFKDLEEAVRRLSLDLGIGRSELAGLTAEAGAAGIAYADLERFMVLTGKAAVGWDMSPREASEKLAYTKAAMGYSIDEMDVLANKINALGDNSAAKEKDILDMFLRVGQAAQQAGVDADSTLALLTGVRSGGMEPEVAARWFGALTGGLRTAEQKPKRVEKGLEMLGLTAKKVAKGMKTDGVGTILDLFDRLEKSPKAVEAATQIFGNEWWDETMRAKGGLAEIRKQLEFIRDKKNYEGSLDKGFAIQAATAANHVKKFNELVSRVGESLTMWTLAPFNASVDAAIAKMRDLESRASWWSRWSAEEKARLEATGYKPVIDLSDNPEEDDWFRRMTKSVTKTLTGSEAPIADQTYDWFWGRAGGKDQQIKAAEESGWAKGQDEKAARVRGMIDQRQRLDKMIGNPAFPDQEGMKARAASLDEKLKQALGSADLGPVARQEMEAYVQAIQAEGTRATAEAQRIAAELTRILSITARPTIDVPMPRAAPGGGAVPGKQSSLSGPTVVHQHINGADPARVARAAQREQDRAIRSARAGALHDLGSNWA